MGITLITTTACFVGFYRCLSYAIERDREDIARLLIEAGCQLSPNLRLPQQLHEVASVSSVLSSYFADNLSPLAAAVRRLLQYDCVRTTSVVSEQLF